MTGIYNTGEIDRYLVDLAVIHPQIPDDDAALGFHEQFQCQFQPVSGPDTRRDSESVAKQRSRSGGSNSYGGLQSTWKANVRPCLYPSTQRKLEEKAIREGGEERTAELITARQEQHRSATAAIRAKRWWEYNTRWRFWGTGRETVHCGKCW